MYASIENSFMSGVHSRGVKPSYIYFPPVAVSQSKTQASSFFLKKMARLMISFSQKCCFVQPKAIAPNVSLVILGMSLQLLFTFVFNPHSFISPFMNYLLFVLSHAHIKYLIPTSFNFLLYFPGCTHFFYFKSTL